MAVRLAAPLTPDCVAVTVAVPVPATFNKPPEETLATLVEVLHVAVSVTSLMVPSECLASAWSCRSVDVASRIAERLSVMLTIGGSVTVMFAVAVLP